MVELPYSLRSLLVEAIGEYCERLDPGTDADVIAEAVVEQFETVAEELSSVDAEDILPSLESTMEGTRSLVIALSDHLEANPGQELGGEEVMQMVEKLCEIDWTNPDGEEEGSGFFGDEVEEDY
jgi:hypothetical protein